MKPMPEVLKTFLATLSKEDAAAILDWFSADVPNAALIDELICAVSLEGRQQVPYVSITVKEIEAARNGETVMIYGPKYVHTVTFDGTHFIDEFVLGRLTADEANLKLFRFI